MTRLEIKNLENQVKAANTANSNERQFIANSCKKLYGSMEQSLLDKYGEAAINDAYADLCNGNFASPFYCEKKKQSFALYANIYTNVLQK